MAITITDIGTNITPALASAGRTADAASTAAGISSMTFPSSLGAAKRPVLKITQLERNPGSIWLPAPVGIGFQNSATYNDAELGILGANAMQSIKSATQNGTGAAEAITKFGSGTIDQLKASGGVGALGSAFLASQNDNAMGSAISIGTASRLNKNITTEFTGVATRSFSFQYKLVPSNAGEAATIKSIISFLQLGLYPDVEGVILKYPPKFKLEFLTSCNGGRLPSVSSIAECFLESFSATYNGANAWHYDGNPVDVDIQMGFKEFRALTAQDISSLEASGTVATSAGTAVPQ